ncbi:MAG: GDSL-type esterase/lipase family protein [Verrucomicrobiales bacterium]|nr:GDSL-type esterase/lipase family protein [Verrucomicrobiales bacterium]
MLHFHECIDGNVPKGSVLFFGDSLIQGLLCTRIQENAVNFGIGTDTTAGVLDRLDTYRSLDHASLVVFGVGLNDLFSKRTDSEIVENIKAFRSRIPIETPVLINAILPVDQPLVEERNGFSYQGLNKRIENLNELLRILCADKDQYWFCDPSRDLEDGGGNLKKSLHTGDGVHLNSAGNEIWIRALEKVTGSVLRDGQRASANSSERVSAE